MKTRNIIISTILATASAVVLSSPIQAANAPDQTQLTGKNFVKEFDKNGDVKRTIITGNAGDGTEALIVSGAAPVVDVAGDKATVNTPLPNSVQGQDAINFLGNNFNKTAADNNVTPEKLKEILNDPTMHLDTATGKIFVIDSSVTGVATIISNTLGSTAPQTGTATFKVTSIVLNGYVYDATKNAVTIKTVTR